MYETTKLALVILSLTHFVLVVANPEALCSSAGSVCRRHFSFKLLNLSEIDKPETQLGLAIRM